MVETRQSWQDLGMGELTERSEEFFSVCRRVRFLCGGDSMTIASIVDVVDTPESLQERIRSVISD